MKISEIFKTMDSGLANFWAPRKEQFEKAIDLFEARWRMLSNLYLLHDELEVTKGILEYGKWVPYEQAAEGAYKYAPLLARSVLPNEIVLDIDAGTEQEAIQTLYSLLDVLASYDIIPLVCYTGNRGFHCHFFVDGVAYPLMFRAGFVDVVNTAWLVDKFVVKSRAVVRELYSWNPKTKYLKVPSPKYIKLSFEDCPVEEINYRDWTFKIPSELEQLCYILAENSAKKAVQSHAAATRSEPPDKLVDRVLELMKQYLVKEYGSYITYHCPFHPPDKHPSFVIFKPTDKYPFWLAVDFHTGEKMSLRRLYFRLKGGR